MHVSQPNLAIFFQVGGCALIRIAAMKWSGNDTSHPMHDDDEKAHRSDRTSKVIEFICMKRCKSRCLCSRFDLQGVAQPAASAAMMVMHDEDAKSSCTFGSAECQNWVCSRCASVCSRVCWCWCVGVLVCVCVCAAFRSTGFAGGSFRPVSLTNTRMVSQLFSCLIEIPFQAWKFPLTYTRHAHTQQPS